MYIYIQQTEPNGYSNYRSLQTENRDGKLSLFPVNGKRKLVFLDRQTINGFSKRARLYCKYMRCYFCPGLCFLCVIYQRCTSRHLVLYLPPQSIRILALPQFRGNYSWQLTLRTFNLAPKFDYEEPGGEPIRVQLWRPWRELISHIHLILHLDYFSPSSQGRGQCIRILVAKWTRIHAYPGPSITQFGGYEVWIFRHFFIFLRYRGRLHAFLRKTYFCTQKNKEPRSGSRSPILCGSEKLVEDCDQIIQDFLVGIFCFHE